MSYQVVIVGAGISGLYAACNLIDSGIKNIVILEAQNRIGGRMHSIPLKIPEQNKKNLNGDSWLELGAQFCHGNYKNHLYTFCINNKIPLIRADKDYPNTYQGGLEFFLAPEGKKVDGKQLPCAKLVEEMYDLFDEDVMAKENSEKTVSVGHFFQTKYKEWLVKAKQRYETVTKYDKTQVGNEEILERLYYFLINELRSDNACEDMNQYSVSSWCEFEDDYDEDCDDSDDEYQEDLHFQNGTQSVLNVLIEKLAAENIEIKLTTPVLRISNWNIGDKILLTCGDEHNQHLFEADHVICTVPLGYLKENHKTLFTPSLPMKMENALNLMSFGNVCKVFMEFENPLPKHIAGGFCLLWPKSVLLDEWKEYGENSESIIFDRSNWYRQLTIFHKVVRKPTLLLGWLTGRAAMACEKLTDKEIMEDIRQHIFTEIVHTGDHQIKYPDLKAVHISRWSCNEYIRGTYSYRTISADIQDVSPKNLAEPLSMSRSINGREFKCPRVLFAGEATDVSRYGTIDGAMQSGKREAERISEYLKIISK